MGGALDELGWVQSVIVNKRSGRIVDGHLRVDLAISEGAPTVPVVYVDLSDEEERLALAIIDPIGAMAGRSDELFASLVGSISVDNEALAGLLTAPEPVGSPVEFTAYGEDIQTDHECPKCGYRWSGSTAPQE